MNKILFSERLATRRKECGYKTQYALAEEYNKRFPSSRKNRKEENSGNSSGILGTIKHYENGNYNGSPKLDIVDNLCKILKCNVDYLLGNIDCKTHDIQFIHDYTGLSEDTISKLSNRISREWVSGSLDKLIPMKTFGYVLFHIFEYINKLNEEKMLKPLFLNELNSNEDGNYNGESEIERKYNELEKEIEHHKFNIDKWFTRTMSLIEENIEKAPDTN